MAGQDWQSSDDLTPEQNDFLSQLQREPYKFNFFQVLRRLESFFPEAPRIGTSLNPDEDALRLAQVPSSAFAPSMLASFEARREGRPPRLGVAFLGLLGANGPLPLHLTTYVESRIAEGDFGFCRFLDIFHHRMLCLFYRAWAVANPAVDLDRYQVERGSKKQFSSRFARQVAAILGIGMPAFHDRDAFPDLAKLFYGGRFAIQTHNAEGLEAVISDFFRLEPKPGHPPPRVKVEDFLGHWVPLPPRCRWQLGRPAAPGRLGETSTIGDAVWDCQYKFRISMGPVHLEDYHRFLPGGERLGCLRALVRNYLGDELAWDLRLVLEKTEVPACRLGESASSLGWTMWLGIEDGWHQHAADLSLGDGDMARFYPAES